MRSRRVVGFSLSVFHERFINDRRFIRYYKEWVKGGYTKQLKPSVDRRNRKLGYEMDNIEVMSWAENRYKQNWERRSRKGRVCQLLGEKVVKVYLSQKDAIQQSGLSQSQMSKVLNGKGQTCGGYGWSYEDNLLKEKK